MYPGLGHPPFQLYPILRHRIFSYRAEQRVRHHPYAASVQTAIYFLLVSVCPAMHILYAGDLVAVTFLIALYFLFRSYQQAKPASYLFHAFVFMGMGSLLFPQLMFFVPVFWIARIASSPCTLRAFSLRSSAGAYLIGSY